MYFYLIARDAQLHQSSARNRRTYVQRSSQDASAFAHGDQADAGVAVQGSKSLAVVLDVHFQAICVETQFDPGFFCFGVAADIIQRFLQDSVNLHAWRSADGESGS